MNFINIQYYDNNTPKSETSFTNGIKNGKCTTWYENGNIESISTYINDKLEGIYKKFNINGNLEYECEYIQNVLHGIYITYNYKSLIKSVKNYEYGKLHGTCIVYYLKPNNDDIYPILAIMNYTNGILDGIYKEFNTKGVLIKECVYNNGKYNGVYQEFDKCGYPTLYKLFNNDIIKIEHNYTINDNNSFTDLIIDKIEHLLNKIFF